MINSVDLQLRAADVTSVSAYVTWRFFDAQEKPYIDGVQLRFIFSQRIKYLLSLNLEIKIVILQY